MKYIYNVDHIYDVNKELGLTNVKGIGVFSSIEKANEAIDQVIVMPGFRDYPRENFRIDKIKIDQWADAPELPSWDELECFRM